MKKGNTVAAKPSRVTYDRVTYGPNPDLEKGLPLEVRWKKWTPKSYKMNSPHSRAVGYHVGFADNMKGLFEHSSHP